MNLMALSASSNDDVVIVAVVDDTPQLKRQMPSHPLSLQRSRSRLLWH